MAAYPAMIVECDLCQIETIAVKGRFSRSGTLYFDHDDFPKETGWTSETITHTMTWGTSDYYYCPSCTKKQKSTES